MTKPGTPREHIIITLDPIPDFSGQTTDHRLREALRILRDSFGLRVVECRHYRPQPESNEQHNADTGEQLEMSL